MSSFPYLPVLGVIWAYLPSLGLLLTELLLFNIIFGGRVG